jgi:hypothetical protein
MRPAVAAFDAIAPIFDQRFGAWRSVGGTASCRPPGTLCGNFRNAVISWNWEAAQAKTQPSLPRPATRYFLPILRPTMVATGKGQIVSVWRTAEIATGEELEDFAARHLSAGGRLFDGAFSNFAPLNCVVDLDLWRADSLSCSSLGAPAMLVLFGTFCPGEMLTEVLHKRPDRRCDAASAAQYRRGLQSVNFPSSTIAVRHLMRPLLPGLCWRSVLESA